MVAPLHEQHATMQTAESALAEIVRHGQAADPRSFALWYHFAAGDSGLLTAAVNKKLARTGRLTAQDIEEIYSAHISPAGASGKIDKLGVQVAEEIDHVHEMIGKAQGSASKYSANLAKASKRFAAVKDHAGIRAVVDGLTAATKEMTSTNARLQVELQAMWEEIAQLRREIETARQESLTDALTSLGNRKYFDMALQKSISACLAANEALTLMLADVDHLRKINDVYGRIVGDRVLRFVAATLKSTLKGKDIAARYGGEEFAMILPKSSIQDAVAIAEQLRHAIRKGELVRQSTGEKHASLTISIGVAALHEGACAQALVDAAEVCLHAAKRGGRDRVVSETDEQLLQVVAS